MKFSPFNFFTRSKAGRSAFRGKVAEGATPDANTSAGFNHGVDKIALYDTHGNAHSSAQKLVATLTHHPTLAVSHITFVA